MGDEVLALLFPDVTLSPDLSVGLADRW